MHEGAALPIAAVVLGAVELLTQLRLVVLWNVQSLLQLVTSVREGTLIQINSKLAAATKLN